MRNRRFAGWWLAPLVLLGILALEPAAAVRASNTFTVTTLADTTNGSCTSTCTLRDAITAACWIGDQYERHRRRQQSSHSHADRHASTVAGLADSHQRCVPRWDSDGYGDADACADGHIDTCTDPERDPDGHTLGEPHPDHHTRG